MPTNAEIKEILLNKGVSHLYHVNSVATSITFLSNGGLLSRGAVEEKGLYQTSQETDSTDKELGVFFDVFFDSVDIHERASRINDYGSVVFVFSINVLDIVPDGSVKITKDNPIRWATSMSESDRYFVNLDELQSDFVKGNFTQHITLKNRHNPMQFSYLEKVIIDDPSIENTSYFDNAVKTINDALKGNAISAPLEIRECSEGCQCKAKYKNSKEGFVYFRFKTS